MKKTKPVFPGILMLLAFSITGFSWGATLIYKSWGAKLPWSGPKNHSYEVASSDSLPTLQFMISNREWKKVEIPWLYCIFLIPDDSLLIRLEDKREFVLTPDGKLLERGVEVPNLGPSPISRFSLRAKVPNPIFVLAKFKRART